MLKLIIALVLGFLALNFSHLIPLTYAESEVLATQSPPQNTALESSQPLETISRFSTKLESVETKIERTIVYKDDPDSEIGEEKVLVEGKDGKRTTVFEVTFFEGKEYERKRVSTDIENPEDKIIAKGTKIIWRTLDTPEGQVNYWRKIRVWATHYDKNCRGCDEWTAIGMRAGKGVIAVDPKVIKLRSQVYVPGYGKAVAGDTGGAIKGNIIDLGFDDARTAGWSARFVDIYLIN